MQICTIHSSNQQTRRVRKSGFVCEDGRRKTSENRGADLLKTYSARRYGWHRLRSMRQEELKNLQVR